MIPLHSYLLYFAIYAVAVAVPGPGIFAIIARALGSGLKATIPAIIGNTVGDLILMSLSALGLAVAARQMGGLFYAVKLAGGLYLIYLGWKYWTAPVDDMTVAPANARQGFVSQLMLTLGNPKGMVFFLALMPSVVPLENLNLFGYAQLCAATLIVIPSLELIFAALAAQIRSFLTSKLARRRLNKSAGAIIIGAGLGVAVI